MFETDFDFDVNDDIFGESSLKTHSTCEASKRKNDEGIPSSCLQKKSRADSRESSEKKTRTLERFDESEANKTTKSLLVQRFLGSPENTSFVGPKKAVQRKFPGPAGLLSVIRGSNLEEERSLTKDILNASLHNLDSHDILCSQMSVAAFSSAPWRQMMDDCIQASPEDVCLPDTYNISWIKAKAVKKVPFLAAVIQSVECSATKSSKVTLLLRDPTGEIEGTIPCKLYEDHANKLIVGAVIVLKQVGVLTTNFGRNHHLTIRENSFVRIYCPQKSRKDNCNGMISKVVGLDTVNIVDMQAFSFKDINESCKQSKLPEIKSDVSTSKVAPEKEVAEISNGGHRKFNFKIAKQKLNTVFETDDFNMTFSENPKSEDAERAINGNVFESSFSHCEDLNISISEKPNTAKIEEMESCSQIVIKSQNAAHNKILQKVFEGVDADSFFSDF